MALNLYGLDRIPNWTNIVTGGGGIILSTRLMAHPVRNHLLLVDGKGAIRSVSMIIVRGTNTN